MALPVYHSPDSLFTPTGPWNILADTGSWVFLAGIRGISPVTNQLVEGEEARIHQVFDNIELAAAAVGLNRQHIARLTVYVTDMDRYRPLVNQVQQQRWGKASLPPRTILQVSGLNQDDFIEIETILIRA